MTITGAIIIALPPLLVVVVFRDFFVCDNDRHAVVFFRFIILIIIIIYFLFIQRTIHPPPPARVVSVSYRRRKYGKLQNRLCLYACRLFSYLILDVDLLSTPWRRKRYLWLLTCVFRDILNLKRVVWVHIIKFIVF